LSDLVQADEVFITNSLIRYMPVTVFGGKRLAMVKPGKVTRNLMKAYQELGKARNCGHKINQKIAA